MVKNTAITRKSVITALTTSKRLSPTDAGHVERLLETSNEPLDQIITKLGLIAESDLATFYAELAQVPFQANANSIKLLEDFGDLNREFCRTHRILPGRQQKAGINAIVVDPFDTAAIDGLRFALKQDISAIVVTPTTWEHLFLKLAPADLTKEDVNEALFDYAADADRLKDMASEEPIVRLVSRLIARASQMRASDIHIEPGPREAVVKARIDGVLREEEVISRTQTLSVISRIKILAQLDIAERRRPQDGRFTFPVAGNPIDLRISTIPTEYGESVVIRILDQSTVSLNFDYLGFTHDAQEILQSLIAKPNGIILVTGPTGSGKTTTLYTMLDQLADGKRKILTIEDPIEQRLANISQTQTNPSIDLTFANALKSFLRHDPDIIMVGEIRDVETARIAVQAALTGHLVFSTLHTNDAASTITRLLDMGIEDYLIASTLNGVIAQRLVRKRCRQCDNGIHIDATKCEFCYGVGFTGRLAIAEILEMDDQFRQCLRNGWAPAEVANIMSIRHFLSMENDGLAKASAGLIDAKEVLSAVGSNGL